MQTSLIINIYRLTFIYTQSKYILKKFQNGYPLQLQSIANDVLNNSDDETANEISALKHTLYRSMSRMNYSRKGKRYMKWLTVDVPFSRKNFLNIFGRKLINTSKLPNLFKTSTTTSKLEEFLGNNWHVYVDKSTSTQHRIFGMIHILHRSKNLMIYDKSQCYRYFIKDISQIF